MAVIDIHGHLNAPAALYAYKSGLLSSRGQHGKGRLNITEEQMAGMVKNHLTNTLDKVGTDVQFLYARPFQLMHSEKPDRIVHWFNEANNDLVAQSVKLAPTRYAGIATLPQAGTAPVTSYFEEMDRCINDLGMVGIMINPDPTEGLDHVPGMGDEWWYPLYEKMVKMNVPAVIHSAACMDPNDTYTNYFITTETLCILDIVRQRVFEKFPDLKIVVSHGGGSVPYQVGRWRSSFSGQRIDFDEHFRKFYFDTVLYEPNTLELLFKIVGADRCMFGTENPGTGSNVNKLTGRSFDDIKPDIDGLASLTDADRSNIYQDVVREAFPRFAMSA